MQSIVNVQEQHTTALGELREASYAHTALIKPSDWRSREHVWLLFCGVLIGGIVGWRDWSQQSTGTEVIWIAVIGILGVYGVWTLVRELAPQPSVWTWLSIPLVLWVLWVGREFSLLILYSALFQVRLVNHSGGRSASWLDGLLVCVLTLWTVYYTENMLFWFSGLIAFVLDALLLERWHRSWIFVLLCGGVGVYLDMRNIPLMRELGFVTLPPWARYLFVLAVVVLFVSFFVRPSSVERPTLSVGRWRASLFVALLCAITPLFQGNLGLFASAFVWAALVILAVELVFRLIGGRILGVAKG